MKHTQGPWAKSDHIYGADGKRVASYQMVSRDDEINEANGDLIAAAPELLDALRPFANFACEKPHVSEPLCYNCIARAAISKAEGKS